MSCSPSNMPTNFERSLVLQENSKTMRYLINPGQQEIQSYDIWGILEILGKRGFHGWLRTSPSFFNSQGIFHGHRRMGRTLKSSTTENPCIQRQDYWKVVSLAAAPKTSNTAGDLIPKALKLRVLHGMVSGIVNFSPWPSRKNCLQIHIIYPCLK